MNHPLFPANSKGDPWQHKMDFWDDTGSHTIIPAIRKYLDENGYAHIPLPENDERLFWDYLRPRKNGEPREYIWHPVIIRPSVYKENAAELYIYNEEYPDHVEMWNDMLHR